MILDPRIVEMRRRAPVSTIPYVGHHNTFRCEGCGKHEPRRLRQRDGKRNVCPACMPAAESA